MAVIQVAVPTSLSRQAVTAVLPLVLSVAGAVLALTGSDHRWHSAFQAVAWAVVAATILVPAWRDRRLPALFVTEDGLLGPRGEAVLRWEDAVGVWVGYRSPRWLPSQLRPLTVMAWDAATLDFARRAGSRALPRLHKLVATTLTDEEVVQLIRRVTWSPVEAGRHLSRRQFLRTLMN
ncbi:hypothetical protein [uncultured Friedmanniella sp.]|uniref:hypothetical protein n=1 Tax=uncultured Friedmanniella sp. TaxID=335381 RepID=UPI0035CAE21D